MSKHHFQVVVVGSGFAGSLMAMISHRLGLSTALIERGRHPRFAIGESSTPLANLLLEEISEQYRLPFLRPLCKWGPWQRQLSQLACGLKRGFTFYRHEFGKPFATDAKRRHQLLVGASPNEEIADTHWYRPDFDQYLVNTAQQLGVTYWDEATMTTAREEASGMRLSGTRLGKPLEVNADFVIDASGPRGFLHRTLGLPQKAFTAFPRTQALFSHFENVSALPGDRFPCQGAAPYPPEQAAVHHVFPGGWVWVLKFNNGLTSAGVAATDPLAKALHLQSGEPGWQRLLDRLPSLAESFSSAHAVVPFIFQPRIAFQSRQITGSHWALIPSAAGVVDPLLSTGFPLTLLGLTRLARILELEWQRPSFPFAMNEYARLTSLELKTTARLVGALYATMHDFEIFKPLTLLYFAVASFSETARRLGKAHLADHFLLCEHPFFARRLKRACALALKHPSPARARELEQLVYEAIEPFDVAGLSDRSRDPWYPAQPADLAANAYKLGASQDEIRAMLRKCGLR